MYRLVGFDVSFKMATSAIRSKEAPLVKRPVHRGKRKPFRFSAADIHSRSTARIQ